MMTIAEVFLLLWALGATLAAMYFYRDAEIGKRVIFDILEDENLRNHMIKGHKELMNQIDAQ